MNVRPWTQELRDWWKLKGKQKYGSKLKFATALGYSLPAVKLWFRGIHFPRNEQCDSLVRETSLSCFGKDREAVRAAHDKQIPAATKKARREDYLEHQEERREKSRVAWRHQYEAKRRYVDETELRTLRADPRLRKNVCRNCSEILRDIGPHLGRCPVEKMTVDQYAEKWGMNRSGNRTRSEETNEKQSVVMKKNKHRPPKWTHKLIQRAQEASLRTNLPGSARLEERLNAQGRRLAGRPEQWKRDASGAVVTSARIVKAKLRGWKLNKIADSVGLSATATSFRLHRMGYDGRAYAFLHGNAVGPNQFRDYRSDFNLTVAEAANDLGVSEDWAYRRLNHATDVRPFSEPIGARLISARQRRTQSFRLRPASARGGRPAALPLSQKHDLRKKYRALLADLRSLRSWICEQQRVSESAIWDWICEEFRFGRLPLLKYWPAFFGWVESSYTGNAFRSGTWVPNNLARQFLADDYDVTEDTVSGIISHSS